MSKYIFFLLISILGISLIFAGQFGEISKDITKVETIGDKQVLFNNTIGDYGKYEIKLDTMESKSFQQLEKYADIILEYNSNKCFNKCSAKGKITLYRDSVFFEDLSYYNIKNFEKLNIENQKILINNEYYNMEILRGNSSGITYEWKIKGEKKYNENIDWIITLGGVELKEWALWSGCDENDTDVVCKDGTFTGDGVITSKNLTLLNMTANGNGTNGGLDTDGTQGNITLIANGSITITNSTINSYGGGGGGATSCAPGNGGRGYLLIDSLINDSIYITNSTINSYGGNGGGVIDNNCYCAMGGGGGISDCYLNNSYVNIVNSNIKCYGGDGGDSRGYDGCFFAGDGGSAYTYFTNIFMNNSILNKNSGSGGFAQCTHTCSGVGQGSSGNTNLIINNSLTTYIENSTITNNVGSVYSGGTLGNSNIIIQILANIFELISSQFSYSPLNLNNNYINFTNNYSSFTLTNSTISENLTVYGNEIYLFDYNKSAQKLNFNDSYVDLRVYLYSPPSLIDVNCSYTIEGGATGQNISVWHNFTGTWHRNQTQNISGIENSTIFIMNLPNGESGLIGCSVNDSNSVEVFSINNTITVDLFPQIDIINPTGEISDLNITYNVTITDTNLDYCYYNVTHLNSVDVSNTAVNCSDFNGNFTLLGDANFTFSVWANDTSGNSNQSISYFNVSGSGSIQPIIIGGTGGGGGTTILSNETFSIETSTGGDKYTYSMTTGLRKEKILLFENLGDQERNLVLTCENIEGTLCQYVNLEQETLDLKVLKETKIPLSYYIEIPSDAIIEEKTFSFNIRALDQKTSIAKELTNEVSINYGLSAISTKLFTLKYLLIFFLSWVFIAGITIIGLKKSKFKLLYGLGGGLLIGLILVYLI